MAYYLFVNSATFFLGTRLFQTWWRYATIAALDLMVLAGCFWLLFLAAVFCWCSWLLFSATVLGCCSWLLGLLACRGT